MDFTRTSPDSELLRRLDRAREYIDDCFPESLDLRRIAEEAYLSPFHFQRLFRRTYRMTPHQYVTHRRIERARELLLYTDFAVSEICMIVGFQSLGSFSSLFSRATGLSPLQYRNHFGRRTIVPILHPEKPTLVPFCFVAMFAPVKGG
ncbi:MAG: helix-turn-helix transcriptional regulator [Ignavibacteriae bacterium]|nr:helix-turn-helix transcriptional regulator [Ignavibacteriota bacterium]MCB9215543.1 helix-turn-helix transcriptional regulator [Ignavibacteria bacterium]